MQHWRNFFLYLLDDVLMQCVWPHLCLQPTVEVMQLFGPLRIVSKVWRNMEDDDMLWVAFKLARCDIFDDSMADIEPQVPLSSC